MPYVAIFNNKRIRDTDIYKYDIPTIGPFFCICGEKLIFRQNRNGDIKYTEHFSHINNVKGSHKTCTYKGKPMSPWHKKMLEVNKYKTRETKREKHFVDTYDASSNRGIEFQHSPIDPKEIISRDNTTDLDWIFDVTKQYSCIWNGIAFCEIPSKNWEQSVPVCKNNVILDTGKKEWILLSHDRRSFCIEIDGMKRHVWIGRPITLDKMIEITCLKNTLTDIGKTELKAEEHIPEVSIIYARCKKSMNYLDPIMREYVLNIEYEKNMVYGIKSVAGSGKTTILLDLARANSDKKILYLAFNRAIVEEIRKKKGNAVKNLNPYTFDALMRKLYISKKNKSPCIMDLRPINFGDISGFSWFKNKPFKLKQAYTNKYNEFCKDIRYNDLEKGMFLFMSEKYPRSSPSMKKTLIKMWQSTKRGIITTWDSIRKMALINEWFKSIDSEYDMVFIDEAQDFDKTMLSMVLNQTTIPKVFVGDPRQAIYEWRGAINSFNNLPYDSHIVEFYKTWRIGDPACDLIRRKFKDCWMVAGTNNNTMLYENIVPNTGYHYLFRTWQHLLKTAANMENIWIHNFESKLQTIKKLHPKLLKYGKDPDMEFEDDLPGFLLKLSADELEALMINIENNLVDKKVAKCCMYTVHSYKGLENDNIRIFNDIDRLREEELYYVALTRGKKNIYIDG